MRPDLANFLHCVDSHELRILLDNGVYRHLRFAKPGDSNQYFDLITYPGGLLYRGDMGTFVFERLTDMFNFFRGKDDDYSINPSYWAEKVQAQCTQGKGIMGYSSKRCAERVKEYAEAFVLDNELNEDEKAEFLEHVKDQILYAIDDEFEVISAIRAFDTGEVKYNGAFEDFLYDRSNTEEYTYHFIWCLYAIVWGIREYDSHQQK